MKEKIAYNQPEIEVCNIISRMGYCMDFDPTVSGGEQLGKEAGSTFDEGEDQDALEENKRNLWDD